MKKILAAVAVMAAATTASAVSVDGLNTGDGYNRLGNQVVVGAFGSDLQLYNASAVADSTNLYIHVGTALRTTGQTTGMWFFLDTKTGGSETLAVSNASAQGFIKGQAGVVMETGFQPDYFIGVNNGGAANIYQAYLYDFGTGTETNFGSFNLTANTYTASGTPITGLAAAVNNSASLAGTDTASAVTTGFEFKIPLTSIGSPVLGNTIKLMVAEGDGANGYYSNQIIGNAGAGAGNIGGGNGNTPLPNFQTNTIGQFGSGTFSGTQTVSYTLAVATAAGNDWMSYQ